MGDIVEFTTMNGHEKVYYEITGSAINFQAKGSGYAGIGLSKEIGHDCDYVVAIGYGAHCWIKKSEERELKYVQIAPRILSSEEYRRFWITWYGDTLRFGRKGLNMPIISRKCKSSELKYVTFFSISEHSQGSQRDVYWKVELPPMIKKPTMKYLNVGDLQWVPIEADTHVLPDGCLIGGYEKENLYIIRAKHRGSLTPGKFVPSEGSGYISWGGESHVKNNYEVLCGFNCKWVPTTRDKIPIGAVAGGYTENIDHEKLYVGRAKYMGHLIPGKVQPSHRVCYIPFEDKEVGVAEYEILVVPENTRFANTIIVPHGFDDHNLGMSDDDAEDDEVESVAHIHLGRAQFRRQLH